MERGLVSVAVMPSPDPALPARAPADRAVWRLGRAALGADALPSRYGDFAADPVLVDRTVDAAFEQAREARALATFARALARGDDTDAAYVSTVRALLDAGLTDLAAGLASGTSAAVPAPVHAIGRALVHLDGGRVEAAWADLAGVEPALLARHVPVEAVDCALRVGTTAAADAARAVVADLAPLDSPTVARIAGSFVAFGHAGTARPLVEELERRQQVDARLDAGDPGDAGEPGDVAALTANLRRWTHPRPRPEPPAGAVRIGVIDYYQPDLGRASRNIGDYVQTLAMLGHLARFQGARFTGDEGLGELAGSLQPRVRPGLRIDGPAPDAHLTPVSRDFSEGDDIAPDTWMVAFGWHLWPMWKLRYGFPYHRNLNPLFVSFHVNHVEALTPEAIDYLKEHGPIGCRDWTTVDLLVSAGVDAFFTGCITTTLSTVFPETGDRPGAELVAAIDIPADKVKANRPVEEATNVADKWRHMGLVDGVHDAIALLEDYQRRYHRIVTSRLHAYLPATSLGIPVTFRPKRLGDVRFDGLLGLTPDSEEFAAIRDGIIGLLEDVLGLVLGGAGRETVYDRWRTLTAPHVDAARERFGAEPPAPATLDVDMLVKAADERRHVGPAPRPDATDVALAVDPLRPHRLLPAIGALVGRASGPVHVWVAARGLDAAGEDEIAAAHPDVPITFLRFEAVDHGDDLLGHTTPTQLDLLLLPELLAEVDRIVVLGADAPAVDVVPLAATELSGAPLAARGTREPLANTWRRVGDLLPPEKASALRRLMGVAHPFGTTAFDTGVVVLDLARLRADGFTADAAPVAAAYGLDFGESLLAAFGGDHQEVVDE